MKMKTINLKVDFGNFLTLTMKKQTNNTRFEPLK